MNTTERIAEISEYVSNNKSEGFSLIDADSIEIDHHFVKEMKAQDLMGGSSAEARKFSFENLLNRNGLGVPTNWMEFWALYDKIEKRVRNNPFYIHIQP